MHPTTTLPRPATREVGVALALYATTVAASMWLGAQRPASFGTMLASSAATAAGTLAMAFYLVRWTPYPRRAFLVAAAVMAAGALAGPFAFPDPGAWTAGVRPMLWMHPWFFIVMAWVPPAAKGRWCAPGSPWAGGLLIGTAVFLTVLSWGVAVIAQRI